MKKLLCLAVILTMLALGFYLALQFSKAKAREDAYAAAIDLMENGEYETAITRFTELEDYKDATPYKLYCEAHYYTALEDYSRAFYAIYRFNRSKTPVEKPKDTKELYSMLGAEIEKEWDERLRLEREDYEERVRKGVPFVDMREEDIGKTSLGHPSPKIEHNSEMVNGKPIDCNLYRWDVNGKRIFSARCMQGKVIQVWDNRSNPWPITTWRPSAKQTNRPSSNDGWDIDEDVLDYTDPEEFYEDFADEFDSLDEAADYYYAHGGAW